MPRLARPQELHPSVDRGAPPDAGAVFPVASAEFLRRNRGTEPAELLKTGRTISNALHPDEWTEWCGAHGLQPPRTSNMITLSSAELVVPALLDGVGIGMGRRPIIDPLLKDGRLVPLFRDRAIGKAAYYLLRAPASRNTAARAVADWLMAEGRTTVESGLDDAAMGVGGDRSGRSRKTMKARGQKA